MFSTAKFVVAGAIVALFGGLLLIAQPLDERGGSVPGALTNLESTAPVEFTATIDYGRGGPVAGFPVVSSDSRFEGTLFWTSTRETYPGTDIEVEAVSVRIENVGGAWQRPVWVQLANLPDDESPPPSGRREPDSYAVTYVGVDGYDGLFIVAEATWDVMTLESDVQGYIFEGEPPVALEPGSGDLPPDP